MKVLTILASIIALMFAIPTGLLALLYVIGPWILLFKGWR